MPWKEISPRFFSRDCGNDELFHKQASKLVPGRNNWFCWGVVSLKLSDSLSPLIINNLCNAWAYFRYDNPIIAATLIGTKLFYKSPNKAELEDWLDRTYHVEDLRTVDDFIAAPRNTPYCTLHYFPRSSEILLNGPHYLVEGPSFQRAFADLARLLANGALIPEFGDEWTRLTPSVDEVFGLDALPPEEADVVAKDSLEVVFGTPEKRAAGPPPGGTRRLRHQYSWSKTNAIVAACKARDLTVTAAFHAAVMSACQRNPKLATPGDVNATIVPVDARQFVAPSTKPAIHIGCGLLGLMLVVPKADFSTMAKTLNTSYRAPRAHGAGIMLRHYQSFTDAAVAAATKDTETEEESEAGGMAVSMTSLGVVDKALPREFVGKHKVEILDFDMGLEQLQNMLMFYCLSVRGHLRLVGNYNDAFMSEQVVEGIRREIEDELFRGLDLELDGPFHELKLDAETPRQNGTLKVVERVNWVLRAKRSVTNFWQGGTSVRV